MSEISEEILKNLPEITDSAEKWFQNKEFHDLLSRSSSVGGMISLGLSIYRLYKNKKAKEMKPKEKAFASLIKVVLESAKDVLRDSDYDIRDSNVKVKGELLTNLFAIFTKEDLGGNSYLPNHEVVSKFRDRLYDLLRESKHPPENISKILIEFNISLEQKATDGSEEIATFYKWSEERSSYRQLVEYIEDIRTRLKYEINPVDKKPWYGYYVKSKAYVLRMDTWKKDYARIPTQNADKWEPEEFLKKEKKSQWYTIIGAPFGVGKTSLVKYIAVSCAEKYLDKPEDPSNYIPVFVRLRYGQSNAYDQKDLKSTLKLIAPKGESKKRKILVICDGLDEYTGNIDELYKDLSKYVEEDSYPNMKVIITTRLRAGWTDLFNAEEYVRLFPFDSKQIDEFFDKYTGERAKITYDMIKEKYALKIQEITRPLFCWMFAITQSSALSDYNVSIDNTVGSDNAKRALIFQQFVHSVIMGKHRSQKQDYQRMLEHYNYDEDIEKKVLRKIAALKQIYPNDLTQKLVSVSLQRFGLGSDTIKQMLEPILTSYFYLQPGTESESISKGEFIDFIHESFKEYLVAEYYIESLFNENMQHRLCIGTPGEETVKFLDGLLELLNTDNESIKNYLSRFIKSLPDHQNNTENRFTLPIEPSPIVDSTKKKIIEHAKIAFEEEKIVYRTDLAAGPDVSEIWTSDMVSANEYRELWLHRWLSVYILDKLEPLDSNSRTINKTKFVELFKTAINYVPYYLQRMERLDLVQADLAGADLREAILAGADLKGADLKGANLTGANLTEANLKGANLTEANLKGANLISAELMNSELGGANLKGADISDANLTGADLREANLNRVRSKEVPKFLTGRTILAGADLTRANLTGADLEGADLKEAELAGADLTRAYLRGSNLTGATPREAILAGADLTRAILAGANLTRAILAGADLKKADLKKADLTRAILAGADLREAILAGADLREAILAGADLTGADLAGADLTGADLKGAKLAGANLAGAKFWIATNLPYSLEDARAKGAFV